jgi:hypothetical protein
VYLIDQALAQCERVVVLACSLEHDKLDARSRYLAIVQHYAHNPAVHVVAVTDALPQTPADSPDFYAIWRKVVDDNLLPDHQLGAFFASELYGIVFAKVLGVVFEMVDLDRLQVHNTNLMVADCLLKVGYAESNEKFILYGKKAANFALLEQNKDGSIFYYGSAQNHINPNRVDHYHSGFEIRCLLNIWLTTKDVNFLKAYQRYYEFYLKNFIFQKDDYYFPFMYPNKLYPINIHSCAESIILNGIHRIDNIISDYFNYF